MIKAVDRDEMITLGKITVSLKVCTAMAAEIIGQDFDGGS